MKIKNKRSLFIGIMTMVLAVLCMVAYIKYSEQKFIISSILLIALSVVNFIKVFSKKGTLEELAENADERDLYLVMKSSHLVIKAMNYLICGFLAFICNMQISIFSCYCCNIMCCACSDVYNLSDS